MGFSLGGIIKDPLGTIGNAAGDAFGGVGSVLTGGVGGLGDFLGRGAGQLGLLGGTIGGLVSGGVKGLINPQMPSYVAPALGGAAIAGLNQFGNYSRRPEEAFAADTMKNTDMANQAMNPDALNRQNARLGMDNPNLIAIQNKAQHYNESAMNQLGRQAQLSAPMQKAQAQQTMAGGLGNFANAQATQGKYTAYAYQQQQQARSSALNSLLGGAGTIAGGAMAMSGSGSPSQSSPAQNYNGGPDYFSGAGAGYGAGKPAGSRYAGDPLE